MLRFELGPFGVQVVVIEPGFIRSGFAQAAVTSMDSVGRDGPYASYNAAVAQATVDAYQTGMTARLAGDPDDVARTVQRAISARRPRPRYPVTASARLLLGLHAALPDRAWDRFLRRTNPQTDPDAWPAPAPADPTHDADRVAAVGEIGDRTPGGGPR